MIQDNCTRQLFNNESAGGMTGGFMRDYKCEIAVHNKIKISGDFYDFMSLEERFKRII